MFGFKSIATLELEESGPQKKSVILPPVDDLVTKYNMLAAQLKVACRAGGTKWRIRLLSVLADNMIPVYDLPAVEKYMDKKGENWGWYPLRDCDCCEGGKVWILERVTPEPKHGYGQARNGQYF